ncbi:hypothetical protein JCM8208_001548 [Rhodotorula glutinis]
MSMSTHDYLSDRAVLAVSLATYAANALLLGPSTGISFVARLLFLVPVNCTAFETLVVANRRNLHTVGVISGGAMTLVAFLGFGLAASMDEPSSTRETVFATCLALHMFATFCIMRCVSAGQSTAGEAGEGAADPASAAEEGRADGGAVEGSERSAGVSGSAAAAAGASDVWAGEASGQQAKSGFFSSDPPAPPGYAAVPSAEQ